MEFNNKVEKFNYFEKLYWKFTLGILGASIALVFISFAIITAVSDMPDLIVKTIITFLIAAGVNFMLSVIRVFKFSFKISGEKDNIGITRSAMGIVLNPVSFIILYILLLIIALSSCTVT